MNSKTTFKFTFYIQLFLLILLIGQSCTVQKRRYMNGWHIPIRNQLKSSTTPETNATKEGNQKEEVLKQKERSGVDEPKTADDTIISTNTFLEKETCHSNSTIILSLERKKVVMPSNIQLRKIVSKKTFSATHNKRPNEFTKNDVGPAKYFGWILGVILALLAIPLFFIIELFFINDQEKSPFSFDESDKDSAFVGAFKKSYNTVFKIGNLILKIIVIAAFVFWLIVLMYLDLGLFMTLLIFGIIILVFALLIYWLDGLSNPFSGIFRNL